MSRSNTIFIPFGHRCSTAALLDRCHLGGEALPFDSLVCQLSVIKDCLENDFRAFLDIENYTRIETRTVNVIDGVVDEFYRETPCINRYYQDASQSIPVKFPGIESTYHLPLALTHHDLSLTQDHDAYVRRIRRLHEVLAQGNKKIYVYVHPIVGINEFNSKREGLIDDFKAFGEFMGSRSIDISGLFFILVRIDKDALPAEPIQLLQDDSCNVYLVHVNKNFIDAGGPFGGDCEREIEIMASAIKNADSSMRPTYKIYFPLFDHIESASNEMRLTHEGLAAHPQVTLVADPELADYLIFCQNHLVDHCPFHTQFRPIKDLYKEKTILLDYDDDPWMIFDAEDFRWKLYFKRSRVDRENGKIINYGGLPILQTAYGVVNAMVDPPASQGDGRSIDIACLFDDEILDSPCFRLARGRLLKFAKRMALDHSISMQIGTVSESGPVGRSGIDPAYKKCLYDSKIVLHANPDSWEGDGRLWEALAAGALVFVDRMFAAIEKPLIDGQHLIFYDLTDEGMAILERKILHYLDHPDERQKIGTQGRDFVLKHHRSINRIGQLIRELDKTDAARTPPTKIMPNLDIIVSIATGYKEISEYRQFISTLRRTGASCPVLLGISDGPEYEPVKRYLLDNAINYFIVPPISPPSKVVNGYRFEQYRQWLPSLDFRYALLMDFRDAYFQRDPFEDVEALMRDCDLNLMSEFQLLTIGNHPNGMNYAWVAEPFGQAAADAIANRVILNSGAIMGCKTAVLAFLDAIANQTSQQNFEFADQGTLNYLAHGGHLNRCGRVKITRAGKSLVNNCGFTEIDLLRRNRLITAEEEENIAFIPRDQQGRLNLFRDHQGWVLDDDGNISYAVHQYDRFQEMDEFVSQLSKYDGPAHVYVNSGNRSYRAERYTLSSREGLRADAIERLIRMIKNLPVGKKPLLVVNAHFERGFVFAHGILNTELLFESETMRKHFFEPASDSQKSEYFCRKWGYEMFCVDEREIFLPSVTATNPEKTASSFREASAQAAQWNSI